MMIKRIRRKINYYSLTFIKKWTRFWMSHSSLSWFGRVSTKLAGWFAPRYKSQCYLAKLGPAGYVSPNAIIEHSKVKLTNDVYLGDRVTLFEAYNGGPVTFCQGVHLYSDIIIETGDGGELLIGKDTHIQPKCSLSAYKGSIFIGERVEIAPSCGFYPYNHAMIADKTIRSQPLVSKGDIAIGDDVWIGFGCIVLEGVKIGHGAVVGAGAVVTKSIPDMAIAVGNPAKVIGSRVISPS